MVSNTDPQQNTGLKDERRWSQVIPFFNGHVNDFHQDLTRFRWGSAILHLLHFILVSSTTATTSMMEMAHILSSHSHWFLLPCLESLLRSKFAWLPLSRL